MYVSKIGYLTRSYCWFYSLSIFSMRRRHRKSRRHGDESLEFYQSWWDLSQVPRLRILRVGIVN